MSSTNWYVEASYLKMSWFINLWKEKKLLRNIFNFFPFIADFQIFVPVLWCCIKATNLYYYEIFSWDIFSKFSSKNFSRVQTDLVDGSSICIKFLNCKYFSHFFQKVQCYQHWISKHSKRGRILTNVDFTVILDIWFSFSFSANTFLQIL